jgi:hypothetical protein
MATKTKITLAAVLIAAFATPALAQDGRIVSGGYQAAMAKIRHNLPPHAQRYHTSNEPNAVFVGGTYAGSDPDPNIRAALVREFGRRN